MSEQVDRRGFFFSTKAKVIGGVGTGVAVAAAIANEVHNSDQGVRIEGPEGIFYPTYQLNQEDLLPSNLDAYVVLNSWQATPEQFRERGIIAAPQLFIPPAIDRDEIKENVTKAVVESAVGTAVLGSELLLEVSGIHTRSKFLERTAAALGLWGLSSTFPAVTMAAPGLELPQGVYRTMERASGIASHLHPEHTLLSFNNLLGASRVLMVANYLREQGISQPQVTFRSYELTVGMEDLLRKDRGAINRLFALYAIANKDLFRARLQGNDLEDFASMIIIQPDGSKKVIIDHDLVRLLRFPLFGTNSPSPKSDDAL